MNSRRNRRRQQVPALPGSRSVDRRLPATAAWLAAHAADPDPDARSEADVPRVDRRGRALRRRPVPLPRGSHPDCRRSGLAFRGLPYRRDGAGGSRNRHPGPGAVASPLARTPRLLLRMRTAHGCQARRSGTPVLGLRSPALPTYRPGSNHRGRRSRHRPIETCVWARRDSPSSPPLERGRRKPCFCLHRHRRTMTRADRNVRPTFTPVPFLTVSG